MKTINPTQILTIILLTTIVGSAQARTFYKEAHAHEIVHQIDVNGFKVRTTEFTGDSEKWGSHTTEHRGGMRVSKSESTKVNHTTVTEYTYD